MGIFIFVLCVILAILIAIFEYFNGMKKSIKEMEKKLSDIEKLLIMIKRQNKD